MKFYVCEHCGNIITFVKSSGVPVMCCGQKMTEIVPGTTDAAVEKHVPVVKAEGSQVTVTVGAVEHPMLPEHFIEWIVLETQQGSQIKHLKPGEKPQAVFALAEGDQAVAAYAYCTRPGRGRAGARFIIGLSITLGGSPTDPPSVSDCRKSGKATFSNGAARNFDLDFLRNCRSKFRERCHFRGTCPRK